MLPDIVNDVWWMPLPHSILFGKILCQESVSWGKANKCQPNVDVTSKYVEENTLIKTYSDEFQATLLDIVSTSVAYTGLGFMKDGGFYQMLRVSSVVFCALLSIPVLKQKLGWHKWIGILIIIAGITLKSVPSIQDFLTGEAEVDACVGVKESMLVNLTATETDASLSQACDKTCQTLIGILLIIISEVTYCSMFCSIH